MAPHLNYLHFLSISNASFITAGVDPNGFRCYEVRKTNDGLRIEDSGVLRGNTK